MKKYVMYVIIAAIIVAVLAVGFVASIPLVIKLSGKSTANFRCFNLYVPF